MKNVFTVLITILLRKRMMEADSNHLLLQMELNSFIDSCILLTLVSSSSIRSYSDMASKDKFSDQP